MAEKARTIKIFRFDNAVTPMINVYQEKGCKSHVKAFYVPSFESVTPDTDKVVGNFATWNLFKFYEKDTASLQIVRTRDEDNKVWQDDI